MLEKKRSAKCTHKHTRDELIRKKGINIERWDVINQIFLMYERVQKKKKVGRIIKEEKQKTILRV
jgi:hypothetical protein